MNSITKNISIKVTAILSLLLLCCLAAQAGNIEAADSAYKQGNYQKAIAAYAKEIKDNGADADLLYNMGNAYMKAGNVGAAVLNYKKALKIDPSHADARNNLQYTTGLVQTANEAEVNDKTLDPTPATPSFFRGIADKIAGVHTDTWATISIVIFLLAICCVALYFFTSAVLLRKIGFFGSGIFVVFSALAYWGAVISRSSARDTSEGVIMESTVKLYAKPETSAKEVAAPIGAGTVVRIMSEQPGTQGAEGWTEVYLNADYSGWIPSSAVEVIRL